jgi:hypothetical protein
MGFIWQRLYKGGAHILLWGQLFLQPIMKKSVKTSFFNGVKTQFVVYRNE